MASRKHGRTRRERAEAAPADAYWLYGQHPVRAALANPSRRVHRLLDSRETAARLAAPGIAPELVARAEITALLPEGAVHQGLAALVTPLPPAGLEALLAGAAERAVVLVLDRVTDPHNAGAIVRSAAAFGALAVVTTRRHAAPETGALAKAASGALEVVPLVRVTNLARALRAIARADFWLLGLEAAAERALAEAEAPARTALVLGAEGAGLRRLTRECCDEIVRLPVSGTAASLNVSAAAAVALYELARGRADLGGA
jgi:23S rRNA (guanosine2251-2'-O)-methyltransferase